MISENAQRSTLNAQRPNIECRDPGFSSVIECWALNVERWTFASFLRFIE
jgi:hypothetical protein